MKNYPGYSRIIILLVIFISIAVPVFSVEQSLTEQVSSPYILPFSGVMDIQYQTLNLGESKSWAYATRDGYYAIEWIISPITPTSFHVTVTRNCDSLKESCEPLFDGTIPGTAMPIGIAIDSSNDVYYVTITSEDDNGEYSIYMRSYKSESEMEQEAIQTIKPSETSTKTVNNNPGVPTNL